MPNGARTTRRTHHWAAALTGAVVLPLVALPAQASEPREEPAPLIDTAVPFDERVPLDERTAPATESEATDESVLDSSTASRTATVRPTPERRSPAVRRAAVRLAISITQAGRTARGGDEILYYRVAVRPTGGTARDTALLLLAQRPLAWAEKPPTCQSKGKDAPLRCELGDLAAARQVRVAVRVPGAARMSHAPRVVAVAGASNVRRETVATANLPTPSRKTGTPTPSPSPTVSTTRPTPRPRESIAPTTTPRHDPPPRPRHPRRPRQVAPPAPAAPPLVQMPQPVMPPPVPMQPAPVMPPPAPVMPAAQMQPPPVLSQVPPLPVVPPKPLADTPSPSVLPPVNAGPSAPPTLSLPGGAAARDNQMTLISPTGLDGEGDGTDWAVVLGIALVAEVALLWVAACLSLWRRRMATARTARLSAVASTPDKPRRRWPRRR